MIRLRELIRNGVSDIAYYTTPHKGGKGAAAPAPVAQPMVTPTPPVDEASVKLDEDSNNKKKKTGKGSLKIPLSTSAKSGLNTAAASVGLKV